MCIRDRFGIVGKFPGHHHLLDVAAGEHLHLLRAGFAQHGIVLNQLVTFIMNGLHVKQGAFIQPFCSAPIGDQVFFNGAAIRDAVKHPILRHKRYAHLANFALGLPQNAGSVYLHRPGVGRVQVEQHVHQLFLSVALYEMCIRDRNMVLGMVPKKSGLFIDSGKAIEITKEYAEKFNLHVDPTARVCDIPVGMKQKVEILKALVRGAKILILDEPTAVLTTQETAELFKELMSLKEQGYTIIFISHKLAEIMQITDRMTILRGGRSMGCLLYTSRCV